MSGPTIERLARSFRVSLEAENKSPRTVEGYLESVELFRRWLADQGHSTVAADVTRRDVEGFIASVLAVRKPSTAATRFFGWCVEEDEIDESPMAKMKPPAIPDEPVPIVTEAEIRRLLKACEGRGFEERRDAAIIALLADTGVRRSELAGLTVDDVDLEQRVIRVMGKGRRPRVVPFGRETARRIDRYLRSRDADVRADDASLWLGMNGRQFRDQGVRQMLERRGAQAGVKVHAHQFRHAFAHAHLANGGNEGDLMMLAGWRSRQMLNRYASSTAAERARSNYESPIDRMERS